MVNRKPRKTNAHRLLVGLGGIGYTPQEAICDIVDNAVSAGARNVYIRIAKLNERLNDNRINNVKEYLIIDDGSGMTTEQIGNALDLGSDDSHYQEGTLSKFGLGLKSASFANGDRLEIVSGIDGVFHKECVDLQQIRDEYFSTEENLDEEDRELVDHYLSQGTGTIIRVTKIRNVEHPNIRSIIEDLKKKLGVIYYYFIRENGLRIHLLNISDDDTNVIEDFDPLFVEEIHDDEKLDENDWDGRTVSWLMMPKDMVLGSVSGQRVKAKVEMTQLPHPPTFQFDGPKAQAEVRSRYDIASGNYGFYVYRNKRLISWADHLDGVIPNDQDFYAFRGRILLDESADELFNINVSKSVITLSGEAQKTLEEETSVYKSKSKKAWNYAKKQVKLKSKQDSMGVSNELASQTRDVDEMPSFGMDGSKAVEANERGRAFQKQSQDATRKEVAQKKSRELGRTVTPSEIGDKDVEEFVKGPAAKAGDDRIFPAEFLEDNLLWEPYISADASQSECVRISQNHRFSVLVNVNNAENYDMQVIFNLLLLSLARAETATIKYLQDYNRQEVVKILEAFRQNASTILTNTCKELDGKLPPANDTF